MRTMLLAGLVGLLTFQAVPATAQSVADMYYYLMRPFFISRYLDVHHEKGMKAAQKQDWETAVVELESSFCHLAKNDTSSESRKACMADAIGDSTKMFSIFLNRLRYDLAMSYSQLAARRATAGRMREADSLGELSIYFLNHIWGNIGGSLAAVYSSVGSIKYDLGELSSAEKLHRKALELVERESQPYSTMRAICGIGLGKAYLARGKMYEAEPVFLNAIEAADSNCTPLGAEENYACVMAAIGKAYLGEDYRLVGKSADAESSYSQSLAMLENSKIPMVLPQLDSLFDNYVELVRLSGREDEAGELDKRVWGIIERRMQSSKRIDAEDHRTK